MGPVPRPITPILSPVLGCMRYSMLFPPDVWCVLDCYYSTTLTRRQHIAPRSQHIDVHDQVMAEAARHHEQVEDLVHPEIRVALLKSGALQGVDDAARGVEQPPGQQPAKTGGGQAGQQLGQGKKDRKSVV